MHAVNELFFELSHEGRVGIVKFLGRGPRKFSEIRETFGFPSAEAARHLRRLQNAQLVAKAGGAYDLTPFGKMVLSVLPYFESLLKFMDFINSHDFRPVPPEVLLQVGKFSELELRTSTMDNVELWLRLVREARRHILAIIDQVPRSIIPTIEERVVKPPGLSVRAIITRGVVARYARPENYPSDVGRLLKVLDFFNNVRVLPDVALSLLITDAGALIFLKAGGKIDYDQGVFGRSAPFLAWCEKIFDLYWKRAAKVTRTDLEELRGGDR
ncbi:MAG: hypothetical protein Kow0069_05500 [Promethearchaeota archaeon]